MNTKLLLSVVAFTTLLGACTGGNTSGKMAAPEVVAACKATMRSTFSSDAVKAHMSAEEIKRATEDTEKDCEDGIIGNGHYRD